MKSGVIPALSRNGKVRSLFQVNNRRGIARAFPRPLGRRALEVTNWDAYYTKSFIASSVTRNFTANHVADVLKKFAHGNFAIVEFGGGNSFIFGTLNRVFKPLKYTIIDKNRLGLKKFEITYPHAKNVELIEGDVLNLNSNQTSDIVFSIGLIEHFQPDDTRRAIDTHFQVVKKNGLVLITFPTPTWLYRLTRALAECFNLWDFPDERPLEIKDVADQASRFGEILHQSIIWPIFLTQAVLVIRKK